MKSVLIITCMTFLVFGSVAHAQDLETIEAAVGVPTGPAVTCQKGSLTRVVEVTYANNDGQPPCEVHYKKTVEQPGHDQILWDSQHTKDYCETNKQEFVEKLKGMGWNCE